MCEEGVAEQSNCGLTSISHPPASVRGVGIRKYRTQIEPGKGGVEWQHFKIQGCFSLAQIYF